MKQRYACSQAGVERKHFFDSLIGIILQNTNWGPTHSSMIASCCWSSSCADWMSAAVSVLNFWRSGKLLWHAGHKGFCCNWQTLTSRLVWILELNCKQPAAMWPSMVARTAAWQWIASMLIEWLMVRGCLRGWGAGHCLQAKCWRLALIVLTSRKYTSALFSIVRSGMQLHRRLVRSWIEAAIWLFFNQDAKIGLFRDVAGTVHFWITWLRIVCSVQQITETALWLYSFVEGGARRRTVRQEPLQWSVRKRCRWLRRSLELDRNHGHCAPSLFGKNMPAKKVLEHFDNTLIIQIFTIRTFLTSTLFIPTYFCLSDLIQWWTHDADMHSVPCGTRAVRTSFDCKDYELKYYNLFAHMRRPNIEYILLSLHT